MLNKGQRKIGNTELMGFFGLFQILCKLIMDYLNHSLIKNEDECELLIQNLLVFGTANETEINEEK